jgi:tetratricopeptide (TPR) repeat protein
LALDTRLGRKVAVKLLPARFTTDADRVRRFAQEARAASALNHPNIITIYDIGEVSSAHYIIEEYVEGETLRQRMSGAPQQRIEPPEAIDIALQIAAALSAAHEAGIMHRDIKPENVMLRRDGIIKVLDFGLAKLTEPSSFEVDTQAATVAGGRTESGVVMGTPRYMSPEQARGEKVDARTDLFSLGVMLYEMVAGRAPFVGATTSEMIAAILRDEPPPLTSHAPDAPPELERIIGQALRKNREERYQTAADLLADLKQLQRDLEFAALRYGERERPGASNGGALREAQVTRALGATPVLRRPAAIIALVGLVIASFAGWFYFNRKPALTEKDRVLLADFENRTGEEIFDGMLKQGLATQLEQSRFISVFPEVRVQQTLRQMERPAGTRVTTELAQEICERQNLKAFITGSIARLGNHYVITLAALQGRSGEELKRTQAEAENKDQVLQALSQAAAQLRAQLGESLKSIQQSDTPLEQATTPNLQALKAFSTSWNLFSTGRPFEALPFAKHAAELDPQFLLAYDQLVVICYVTEQPEAAAEYEAKIVQLQEERAAQSKEPASESHKLDIASWYHRLVTGSLNKSLEYALVRHRMFPDSVPAQIDLAYAYVLTGQFEQALGPGNQALRLNRNIIPGYKFLGIALIRLNRFAEAKDLLTQALQLKLDASIFHTILYQIAFINADAAGMQEQLAWSQGKPDEYIALDWQTGATAFVGQWRKAQELSRRAIDLAARSDNREVAARYATEQALRSAVLGTCQDSKASAAQGLTFERGRIPLERAALALALCGEAKQAKSLTDELTKRFPEDTFARELWLPSVRAASELQRGVSGGGATQALEQLRLASRYEAVAEFWPQHLRGQAYLKLKRGLEAAAEFQKILDHRGYAPLSPLYPLAHLGLARAAALTGDAAKSRKAWDDFFAAWKEADTDLPILSAVKKE